MRTLAVTVSHADLPGEAPVGVVDQVLDVGAEVLRTYRPTTIIVEQIEQSHLMQRLPEVISHQASAIALHRDGHACTAGIDACLVLALGRSPQGVGQMVMVGQIELAAVADDDRYRVHQQVVPEVSL